ncbi:RcpC/CpaB family pilus assembly protein [Arthrobacter sp. BPSS-3]|uniref:RcpC/CpaB family pilus assembly protein n=2 Tax=unclassified Arthrobacter TaxID=235627 RepID=UPI0037DC926D
MAPARLHFFRTGTARGPSVAGRPAGGRLLTSRRSSPRRLRRWVGRNRRLIAALLLCLAAGLAVQQLTPAPPPTVTAWAAAGDLPAGRLLAPGDLNAVQVPPGVLPDAAIDPSTAEGQQLGIALSRGQLLSSSFFVGPGLLTGSPPGSAAVPLRMADPASIQLVSPGQLVNIVLTGGNGFEQAATSEILAARVPVLWTSARGGRSGQWLDVGDTDGLMVVAADPEQSRKLAGASTQGKLFFVLVGPGGP